MTGKASVFQTGGGGYDYEHYVQAAFITSLILQNSIPVFPNGKIVELAFQCKNRGYHTDDLFIKIKNGINEHRVLVQIKYNIAISEGNEIFSEVINAFWKDFNNNTVFDKEKDKFFLIKSSLTNNDKNHIAVLSEWASTHSDENDFYTEVERISIKKEKLTIISNQLKKANKDIELTKKQVWQFLNCFNLLAYDYTVQSSVDETHLLNLIRLSKSNTNSTSPIEIWHSIIAKASEYNRNGGSILFENIKAIDLYKHFDLSFSQDAFLSLKKLQNDGALIIKPFKSTIQNHHIERSSVKASILNSINNNKITFITGQPGVGKSAIIKELLIDELKHSSPFIFKADQFNKSTFAQVFTEVGISHNLLELFSTISLLQDKIIIIDSAEKLLEGEPDNAFKQLLFVMEEIDGLHLVLTSRSYAVNVVTQKFSLKNEDVNLIEIPLLSDDELSDVENVFPQLKRLLINQEIKKVLRSPKYLDLALNSINKESFDSEDISLSDFKDKLWNQVIENATVVRNGLARKRRKTFTHIAVGRASSMQLFYKPDDNSIDEEALDALINDDVLIQNKTNDEFSPSHDILEDWALVKHIVTLERNLQNKEDLFKELGNQPALRRAFRLWVEELIINDVNTVISLVEMTIDNTVIERYWVDEILTAIFRSNNCETFFETFDDRLLKNDGEFLNRCILIIRTTCREYNFNKESSNDILFPIGSGWREILHFIALNIEMLENIRNSISKLLLDWEYQFIFNIDSCSAKEIAAANSLVFHFIKEMEQQNEFWYKSSTSDEKEKFICMLFGFSPYSASDIENFLIRCSERKNDYGRLNSFDELVIKKALYGLRNKKLVQELPNLLIKLANQHWKYSPPQKEKTKGKGPLGFEFPSRVDKEDSWGIERHKFDFFPSGIYKTFVYNLLFSHSNKGIAFVVDFTNYATLSYSKSEYGEKDELNLIEVKLNNGAVSKQYSNGVLWNAYRGTTVTHYLLECILISLEKYLLEVAQVKVVENKLLKSIVDYCLINSNSVSITSVLVSVFIAYPKAFGESILPILRTRQFYELDVHRASREISATAIADMKIPFAQKEKWEFNSLTHRKKYMRGLRDLIFEYQINIGSHNEELHEIFDGFYKSCGDDLFWEKAVTEMDIRKFKTTLIDKEKGVFQLEVSYPEEIQKVVEDFTEGRKDEDTSLNYSGMLHKANEGTNELSLENWNLMYKHFSSKKVKESMFDMPVTLSVYGLKNFVDKLNKSQKKWALETIFSTIQKITRYMFFRGRSFDIDIGFNIREQQTTLEAIHLLYQHVDNKKDLKEVDVALAYLLICPLADYEERYFLKYFRKTFSELFPNEAKSHSLFLIKYSKFITENSHSFHRNEEEEKEFRKKEFKFIKDNIKQKTKILIDSINFNTYEAHYLINALLMIPSDTKDKFQQEYVLKLAKLILDDLKLEMGESYRRSKRDRKTDYKSLVDLRFYLNEVLLFNDIDVSKRLIDVLTAPFFGKDFKANNNVKDIYELSTGVFDTTITRFDDVVVEGKQNEIKQYGTQFWALWKYLFEKIKANSGIAFKKQLLLDANEKYWSIKSDNWKGFLGKHIFYKEMITYFGYSSLPHIINVFSSFGEKTFLPFGIQIIVNFIEDEPKNVKYLESQSAVKLIQLLFNNHITVIKEDQSLISNFMFLLNKMVDLGYCEVYLIRECVIIYKKPS